MNFMVFPILFISLVSFSSYAKTYNNYLEESENGICKALIEKEGHYAIYRCGSLMVDDSQKKMIKRMSEINKTLKKINNNEITNAFMRDQLSWEAYKRERCAYITLGIDKESSEYQFNLDICNAVENYRRIETLEGEPSFP